MSARKYEKKAAKKNASKTELIDCVSCEMFEQFQESVLKEMHQFKETIQQLENKLLEKDMEIFKLKEAKENQAAENEYILRLIDNLERDIKINEGGFVLSGKDFYDIHGKEYVNFNEKFRSHIYEIAGAKDVDLGKKTINFFTYQIGHSNSHLTRVNNSDIHQSEKEDIVYFVEKHLHNTPFEWEGIDGRKRKVIVKKSKSFIDRKMGQLMYKVYTKIEEETKEKVHKQKKNGKLFLNNREVEIKRSCRKISALIENSVIAEMCW